MKKQNIFLALVMVAFLGITSCKKSFLDETVESSFTPANLQDSLSFESAIVGVHQQFGLWHTYQSQGWYAVWQLGTDVAFAKSPANTDPISVPYFNYEKLTPTDLAAQIAWKWGYNLINNCNIVLASVDNATMGQANKNSIKAEASFYRAYAYNTLATLFGKVPVITTPLSGPRTDFLRAPLSEVNHLIIDDLNFAKGNLPSIGNVKANTAGRMFARPHKAMSSQLLAEVYLRTGDDAKAEQEADAVINSGDFSLITSRYGVKAGQPGDPFSDMFIYGNQRRSQGNKEVIWVFEIENPNNVVGGAGPATSAMFPGLTFATPENRRVWVSSYFQQPGMTLADSLGGRGVSRANLTYFVLNDLYGQNDMRNSRFNIRRTFYYNNPNSPNFGRQVVPGPGVDTISAIVPYITKWNQFDPANTFGLITVKDIIIMRLGETYLLKAEALFKQGNLAGAANTLNILRARAGASSITANDVTMDFILDERARELLAEENRRMTLMRTRTLLSRVAGRGVGVTNLTDKNLLLPIPLTEIQLNKDAKLEQNPGY